MSRTTLIALLLGLLLVAAPIARASDEDYEEEGDDDEAPAAAEGDASEADVMVITTKIFDEVIKKYKYVLVEFYAPWCGHCKSLAPEYAKAATAIKHYDQAIVLGKVDATVESELGTRFGVSGYPTLKWFVDGEPTDYNGPREADGIVNWIKKKTGPPAVTIDEADKLTELEEGKQNVVVAYFKKLEGDDYEAFKSVAQKIEDVTFVETTHKDVAAIAGLKKHGVAVIKNHKGEERATVTYDGKLEVEELKTWVNGEKIPLTIEFNEDNSEVIFNSGLKRQVLLWAGEEDLKAGSKVFDAFKKVASKYKGQLVFVTVNNEGASHEPVTNFFGLKDVKGPVTLGFYMEKNKKYKMAEDFSEKHLDKFAAAVIDGTAYVEYKSAPIPENNKDGEVTIVVGKTVDSIVFDETKDVLLEVYAPWCGHCKQLDPIYKKLAKRFKKVDSVVIAKMDGTENEHSEIEVKGFPTLFFKAAGKDSKLVQYEENDRTLKGLTKFIKESAKIPYTLPKKEKEDKVADAEEEKAAKDEL